MDDVQKPEVGPTPEQQARLDAIKAEEEKNNPKPPEPPTEEKPEPSKAPPPKDDDVDDDIDDDDEEDDDKGKEKEPPKEDKQERKPKFVRLSKHLKLEKKYKDLLADKAKGEAPKEAPPVTDTEAIKELAETLGIDEAKAKKVVETLEKQAYERVKKELGPKFENIEAAATKAKQDAEEAEQEKLWQKQFDELLTKFPDEAENIKSNKGKLKKLAFTREYSLTPLDVIYKGVDGLRDPKKSVESGRGGSRKAGDGTLGPDDFEKIIKEGDDTAIGKMDSETFAKFQVFIKANKY